MADQIDQLQKVKNRLEKEKKDQKREMDDMQANFQHQMKNRVRAFT
jgi:hypothetical protein